MSIFSYFTNIWDILKEADLRPLREQALRGVRIAIVGAAGSGRSTLADQLRQDPGRPANTSDSPVLILDLVSASQAASADLIILMVDSRKADTTQEQELAKAWHNAAKKVLVVINHREAAAPAQMPGEPVSGAAAETASAPPESSLAPMGGNGQALATAEPQSPPARLKRGVVRGSILDDNFLIGHFAQAVIELIPDQLLALGRFFPLFRIPIARYMINDTCFTNAAYSLSTGLAEMIPILGIPVVLTDTVILTKNQLFMVYKLGLTFGFSTRWQDYVGEFSSVLGGGFVWRQIARSLIGLIPVWGIAPKTAIAYAGTYVIGNAVLQWYLTGRHLSKQQMRQVYDQALARGRELTRWLVSRRPKLRLPKPRLSLPKLSLSLPKRQPRPLPAIAPERACANCGKTSAADASFCQYCGHPLNQP
jgi:uncharacterized protein (DUF697 family)